MAYFLFVDESGQDQNESPCEILTGVAIRDNTLWPLIKEVHKAELECFGTRFSIGGRELKARKLLKTKVFRQAAFETTLSPEEQWRLSKTILERGAGASPRECAALARAKLQFTRRLLGLCVKFKCSLFACIVPKGAPRPANREFLRKDYSYLFERFFYFLDDKRSSRGAGIIVFDELEKAQSHILIGQMDSYFKNTQKGRDRSELIIPEPFFVHSDLTTGIQIADLMAYLLIWGYFGSSRTSSPARPELKEFAQMAVKLAYDTSRSKFTIRGITAIQDLRASSDRR